MRLLSLALLIIGIETTSVTFANETGEAIVESFRAIGHLGKKEPSKPSQPTKVYLFCDEQHLIPLKGKQVLWAVVDKSKIVLKGHAVTSSQGLFEVDLAKSVGKEFEIEVKSQKKKIKIENTVLSFEVSC